MNIRELQAGEIWLNHPEENRSFRNNQFRKINNQNDYKSKYNVRLSLKRKMKTSFSKMISEKKENLNKEMNLIKIMTSSMLRLPLICSEENS
jgi:hypothetical protein